MKSESTNDMKQDNRLERVAISWAPYYGWVFHPSHDRNGEAIPGYWEHDEEDAFIWEGEEHKLVEWILNHNLEAYYSTYN